MSPFSLSATLNLQFSYETLCSVLEQRITMCKFDFLINTHSTKSHEEDKLSNFATARLKHLRHMSYVIQMETEKHQSNLSPNSFFSPLLIQDSKHSLLLSFRSVVYYNLSTACINVRLSFLVYVTSVVTFDMLCVRL